jgi:hypothetical protein
LKTYEYIITKIAYTILLIARDAQRGCLGGVASLQNFVGKKSQRGTKVKFNPLDIWKFSELAPPDVR